MLKSDLLLAGNANLCGNVPKGLPTFGRYFYTNVWEKLSCTCCDGDVLAPVWLRLLKRAASSMFGHLSHFLTALEALTLLGVPWVVAWHDLSFRCALVVTWNAKLCIRWLRRARLLRLV